METHEAFLQLCLKSLNQKECDQYIVEMIEAGIDISYLFNTSSTPTLSEVKTAYEKYIKDNLMLSISSGMNLSDISNIFLQDLALKVRLEKLSGSLNKEKQISYNSCEIDDEKSIANCTDKEKQSSDKLKPDSECESSSLKSNISNSQVSSDICEMKDSNKVDSEQITFWICPSCTSHNPIDLLHCQICDLIKDFERANINGVAYFILSLPVSQYSLGAVSACTNMSFQALSECLHNLSGSTVPFGCTVDVLKNILTKGSKYVNTGHQDLEDVISSRPDVMDKLYQVM